MAAVIEKSIKRVNLVLPEALCDELERVAAERHTTVTGLLRAFIRLGLLATHVEGEPGRTLIVREGNHEQQLILI